jgi:hypothetical protein
LGGKKGARRGAKIGGTVGVLRKVDRRARERERRREAEYRVEYQSTPVYIEAPHTNFNEPSQQPSAPHIAAAPSDTLTDIVLRRDGADVLGVGYPSNWKQTLSDSSVTAVSADGLIWSATAMLEAGMDRDSGVASIRDWLKGDLDNAAFQDVEITDSGTAVLQGTAKGKESGADVEFVAGVFDVGDGITGAIAFIADAAADELYERTIIDICESVRTARDFPQESEE